MLYTSGLLSFTGPAVSFWETATDANNGTGRGPASSCSQATPPSSANIRTTPCFTLMEGPAVIGSEKLRRGRKPMFLWNRRWALMDCEACGKRHWEMPSRWILLSPSGPPRLCDIQHSLVRIGFGALLRANRRKE